ncbi:uncharacterized protein LOC132193234 [Neocloeon triangulifer]|uniref:uncharacterized protein LOC132193234 n=1 Tax=Neocloeon triangulifer TaxID=2078957 RepID=UPI00286EF4E6|nr:uncharacterized protein LOC132193234 [Neocloeon triangulifer]
MSDQSDGCPDGPRRSATYPRILAANATSSFLPATLRPPAQAAQSTQSTRTRSSMATLFGGTAAGNSPAGLVRSTPSARQTLPAPRTNSTGSSMGLLMQAPLSSHMVRPPSTAPLATAPRHQVQASPSSNNLAAPSPKFHSSHFTIPRPQNQAPTRSWSKSTWAMPSSANQTSTQGTHSEPSSQANSGAHELARGELLLSQSSSQGGSSNLAAPIPMLYASREDGLSLVPLTPSESRDTDTFGHFAERPLMPIVRQEKGHRRRSSSSSTCSNGATPAKLPSHKNDKENEKEQVSHALTVSPASSCKIVFEVSQSPPGNARPSGSPYDFASLYGSGGSQEEPETLSDIMPRSIPDVDDLVGANPNSTTAASHAELCSAPRPASVFPIDRAASEPSPSNISPPGSLASVWRNHTPAGSLTGLVVPLSAAPHQVQASPSPAELVRSATSPGQTLPPPRTNSTGSSMGLLMQEPLSSNMVRPPSTAPLATAPLATAPCHQVQASPTSHAERPSPCSSQASLTLSQRPIQRSPPPSTRPVMPMRQEKGRRRRSSSGSTTSDGASPSKRAITNDEAIIESEHGSPASSCKVICQLQHSPPAVGARLSGSSYDFGSLYGSYSSSEGRQPAAPQKPWSIPDFEDLVAANPSMTPAPTANARHPALESPVDKEATRPASRASSLDAVASENGKDFSGMVRPASSTDMSDFSQENLQNESADESECVSTFKLSDNQINSKKCAILPGFEKATSNNLPNVPFFMLVDFLMLIRNQNPASRHYKDDHNMRRQYTDAAVGFVQVMTKRDENGCQQWTVLAKVTPETSVRNEPYNVQLSCTSSKVLKLKCYGCPAQNMVCKHCLVLLSWVHYRSSVDESCTSVPCYWRKSLLSSINTDKPAASIVPNGKKRKRTSAYAKDGSFLDDLKQLEVANSDNNAGFAIRSMFRAQVMDTNSPLCLHNIACDLLRTDSNVNLAGFLDLVTISLRNCEPHYFKYVQNETRNQSLSPLWYTLRYGRITASIFYEASRWKRGSTLVRKVFGAKFKPTEAMRRGLALEEKLRKQFARENNVKVSEGWLCLSAEYPLYGASPDGVGKNFIIEIKSPFRNENVTNFVRDGKPTPKVLAQILLQLRLSNKTRCYLLIPDENYEKNGFYSQFVIDFNAKATEQSEVDDYNEKQKFFKKCLDRSNKFWRHSIYPRLLSASRHVQD